jgi:D-alanyl-D-alanine carboxypeptidase
MSRSTLATSTLATSPAGPSPSTTHPGRRLRSFILVAALLVVAAAVLVGLLHHRSPNTSSGSVTSGGTPSGVPTGRTAFDSPEPAVTHLDAALLHALRQAAADASADGIEFHLTSGWRSRDDQERLFREAVSRYGSAAQAARWVAVPGTSAHEAGNAVDLGPSKATSWLSQHGAGYGLCQIYRNEPWHYELRPDAVEHGCPPAYTDPTQDPRLHR